LTKRILDKSSLKIKQTAESPIIFLGAFIFLLFVQGSNQSSIDMIAAHEYSLNVVQLSFCAILGKRNFISTKTPMLLRHQQI
jgi:hypothetical protein